MEKKRLNHVPPMPPAGATELEQTEAAQSFVALQGERLRWLSQELHKGRIIYVTMLTKLIKVLPLEWQVYEMGGKPLIWLDKSGRMQMVDSRTGKSVDISEARLTSRPNRRPYRR